MSAPVPDLRAAIRARLRHERDLGLESLARVPLQYAAPAPVQETPARTSGAAPVAAVRMPEVPRPQEHTESPADIEKRWSELEAQAKVCVKCPLHAGRNQVVFGEGDRNAQLVFVGEAPGADEDACGRPFVGKAGQLLEKIITAMGLRRSEVYICNTVKCRPPDNRTPAPEETSACWPYLEQQLELIAPRAIVALGSPAAKTLLKTTQGITTLRGKWQLYKGIRVMPTYHPAFVLRQYTEKTRGEVWSDMQQVMNYLKEA